MTESNTDIVGIIVDSGLLDTDMLREFASWGTLPDQSVERIDITNTDIPITKEGLNQRIEQSLQDKGFVLVRETDLDIVNQYLTTLQMSELHLVDQGSRVDESVAIQIGTHLNGDLIIPWDGEDVSEILTNGETYVNRGHKKFFFNEVREVFYGTRKVFLVCVPSTVEVRGDIPNRS